ncbi:MAG: type II CRISPR-associated endonuclease Cas1 [Rickettsiales bacterium]|jgi:CRISPR-associated protein Cas1|nr:type II CRISPR-associated endonuclease Cas1 [Rickettsiales bacterium]
MGWRILSLTKPCKISVRQSQLFYEPADGESHAFPIEDISVIVLDTGFVQLSGTLLAQLASSNAAVFSCDETHMPNGIFMPFAEHSRMTEIANAQAAASEPLKKRLWQMIVRRKIMNQASVLRICGRDNAELLCNLAERVQSGDSENIEAYAAGVYWRALFDGEFQREKNYAKNPSIRNSALNYGYAVMRGAVARSIAAAGFVPCFGIHHCSELNSFNLADDLIEPFRAYADFAAATTDFANMETLTPELKNKLISALLYETEICGESMQILKACTVAAESLAKCLKTKSCEFLKLPEMKNVPKITNMK